MHVLQRHFMEIRSSIFAYVVSENIEMCFNFTVFVETILNWALAFVRILSFFVFAFRDIQPVVSPEV